MNIKFTNNFRASPKNVGHKKSNWNPQEWSGALEIYPKGQGVGCHTFEKNPSYGHMPTVMDTT